MYSTQSSLISEVSLKFTNPKIRNSTLIFHPKLKHYHILQINSNIPSSTTSNQTPNLVSPAQFDIDNTLRKSNGCFFLSLFVLLVQICFSVIKSRSSLSSSLARRNRFRARFWSYCLVLLWLIDSLSSVYPPSSREDGFLGHSSSSGFVRPGLGYYFKLSSGNRFLYRLWLGLCEARHFLKRMYELGLIGCYSRSKLRKRNSKEQMVKVTDRTNPIPSYEQYGAEMYSGFFTVGSEVEQSKPFLSNGERNPKFGLDGHLFGSGSYVS